MAQDRTVYGGELKTVFFLSPVDTIVTTVVGHNRAGWHHLLRDGTDGHHPARIGHGGHADHLRDHRGLPTHRTAVRGGVPCSWTSTPGWAAGRSAYAWWPDRGHDRPAPTWCVRMVKGRRDARPSRPHLRLYRPGYVRYAITPQLALGVEPALARPAERPFARAGNPADELRRGGKPEPAVARRPVNDQPRSSAPTSSSKALRMRDMALSTCWSVSVRASSCSTKRSA